MTPDKKRRFFLIALGLALSVSIGLVIAMEENTNRYYYNSAGYSGCSCCTSGTASTKYDPDTGTETTSKLELAEKTVLDYFRQNYGDLDVSAKSTDFGCHVQVELVKKGTGEVIKSYAVYGNSIIELN